MANRRKVLIMKVSDENAWYKGYKGKFLWVDKRHNGDTYQVRWVNQTLFVKKNDVLTIPKYIRRLFRTINSKIPWIDNPTPVPLSEGW